MELFSRLKIFLFLPIIAGCAAIAVTGAGVGVSYTLTNIAYKTFNSSIDEVDKATSQALNKMAIKIIDDSKTENGRRIKASTKELDITIDLERVTSRATRIKVDASKNHILKDKATATEIIHQTERILEGKG